MKRTYEQEAQKFAAAVDIAIETMKKFPHPLLTAEQIEQSVKTYEEWKQMALHPQPQFKKIASLKYLVEALFTYFNEASGKDVEYFWKEIRNKNLGYERENKLEKILLRGYIKTRHEYDFVTDGLVIYQQEGAITQEQAAQLSAMLGDYENRKLK